MKTEYLTKKKDQAHKQCDGQTNGQNKLDLLYSEASVSSELQLSVITESVILILNESFIKKPEINEKYIVSELQPDSHHTRPVDLKMAFSMF